MDDKKAASSFAALFFKKNEKTSVLYAPPPAPSWISGSNPSGINISESGLYCIYLLVFSAKDGGAVFTVNGNDIAGSYAAERGGEICSSAVCSIKEGAVPCMLGVDTFGDTFEGLLLVIKFNM
ncbi:MAG: hypothetical protein IKU65_03045 [Oscillospiraceae bacterium]|nr:hypothetical protein [Oscillospiraceae bacterium]